MEMFQIHICVRVRILLFISIHHELQYSINDSMESDAVSASCCLGQLYQNMHKINFLDWRRMACAAMATENSFQLIQYIYNVYVDCAKHSLDGF